MSLIDGVGDYKKVKKESCIIKLGKIKVYVLGIDALIKSKKTLNRPRDRQAVIQLEAIKKLKKGL